MNLEARDVTVVRGQRRILDAASVAVREKELVALVGPNGAGKSTLLGVLAGDITPADGAVVLDDKPLPEWSTRELARRRAVLPQETAVAFPFTVADVVQMGRAPWAGSDAEADDDAVVAEALRVTDMTELGGRTFPSLSGGERARAALARVLAQHTPILLLDEPTAALDLHHTEVVLDIARTRADLGDAVVVVLHDLGLAAAYADRIVMLAGGRVVADGKPHDVCTPDSLSAVYGHDIEVINHPRTGALIVVPRRD